MMDKVDSYKTQYNNISEDNFNYNHSRNVERDLFVGQPPSYLKKANSHDEIQTSTANYTFQNEIKTSGKTQIVDDDMMDFLMDDTNF
jgi:hypothetical protein